jgi:hypothetical protein
MLITNSNDAFGTQTRDHPACNATSQPIAPPRARELNEIHKQIILVNAEILMLWYVECALTGNV